jgi:amino acid adenylation domain-containing protein
MINALADSRSVAEERQRLFKLRLAQKGIVAPHTERIRRRERNGPMPLSFAQQRLWFIDQLHPHSSLYNLSLTLRLSGVLNVAALNQTFTRLVARHESLRTTFTTQNGEPVQVIHSARATVIPLIDLTELPEQDRRTRCEQLLGATAEEPFDLSSGPLLRVLLVRLQAAEHVVLLAMHHIISDGWSLGVLVREVTELYEAYTTGREPELAELEVQYGDYAAWQREWLSGPALERKMEYWRRQLSGTSGVLEIPADRARPAVASHRGAVEWFEIEAGVAEGLRRVSRDEGVTLFMLLLAAWQALLFRYSGNSDVPVGIPIANRNRKETEGLIGFFVNTLVIRSRISGELQFTELLKQVRETALEAYAHQDVPFEKLVEELQPERSLSHHPLFQVMFLLQNAPVGPLELTRLQLSSVDLGGSMAKFDLTLEIQETNLALSCTLEYATDLFERTTIWRILGHFDQLLRGVVADPAQTIARLPLLTRAEQDQLIAGWNQTEMVYPRAACVHQLFEAQVKRTPEALAVVMDDQQLTYAELNARSHRLACYLQDLGVGPEVLVGICVERSPKMIVGLLAILKAGGAYVPLDPAYPKERLALMVEDSGITVMLTEKHLLQYLPKHETPVVCLDEDVESDVTINASLRDGVAASNLAYVIYTSGSTGKPKGVQIAHQSLVNLLCAMQKEPGIEAHDRLLAVTSLSFDIAALEVFLPLIVGARVVLASREVSMDGVLLQKYLHSSQATIMQATPATWRLLLNAGWRAHSQLKMFCCGEPLTVDLSQPLMANGARLWNLYGPTESTIYSTGTQVRDPAQISIGYPIANNQAYVLDSKLQPAPVGIAGELYIGGDGLARGYLNQPALTAERFVPDPYGKTEGGRLYRTGDLVRRMPDGCIDFLGRLDNQVKLRGFRIELGEIEASLNAFPGVRHGVVAMRGESAATMQLVAYLVPEPGIRLENTELRSALAERLPEYMVPSVFVQVAHLPLTPNGKVDRKALPDPEKSSGKLTPTYVAPRNTAELWLAEIWEQILGVRPVGVTNSFFELGGHSLLIVRLMDSIKSRWGRELPLTTLFQYPTIEKLAVLLRDRETVYSSPLVALQTGGSKRPFFCVHAVGGSVFPYLPLRDYLGPQQPLYGLQVQALEDDVIPLARVEDMAAAYIAALRTVQPDGPYLLGGWSMGGVIAYEMTQQLQAQGESVDLLVLIDSTSTPLQCDVNDDWAVLQTFAATYGIPLENLDVQYETLRQLDPNELLDHVFEQVRTAKLIPADIGTSQVRRMLNVLRSNMQAMQDYVSQPLANRVHLIRAVDPATPDETNLVLGWAKLATEVEVATVSGNHFNLFREPQVAVVAEQLKLWLTESVSHQAEVARQG